MESWLLDVKRVRIPRPKMTSSGGAGARGPAEPPKDYLSDLTDDKAKRVLAMDKLTEELRRGIQDKL